MIAANFIAPPEAALAVIGIRPLISREVERIRVTTLREIDRLRKSGLPLGPNLFEEAGRNTGIGSKTTVSNLYYGRHSRKR